MPADGLALIRHNSLRGEGDEDIDETADKTYDVSDTDISTIRRRRSGTSGVIARSTFAGLRK